MKHILRNLLIGSMILAGATTAFASTIPNTPALYESYLANSQGTTDTTLTLASGTLRDGTSLSGFNCFTIDANTPSIEYECGTVSGVNVTGLMRGLDSVTGTTTVTALQFAHRRGADVKITEYPILAIVARILQDIDSIPNAIMYSSGVSTTTLATNRANVASVGLVQDTAFSGAGVINATTLAKGMVQLSTAAQAAANTSLCSSGASCALTSSISSATSLINGVVVGNSSGAIDTSWITNIATSTNIGSTPAFQIGMQKQIITTTGSSTFAVPSGITKLDVTVQAPGASGGSCNNSSGNGQASGGGGAGGWATKIVDVTGTSSIAVFVGATSTATTEASSTLFGTFVSATGGNPSTALSGSAGDSQGGTGGLGVNGDINIPGGQGQGGLFVNGTGVATIFAGSGGSSMMGFGGASIHGSNAAVNGVGYGSGGSGAGCINNSTTNPGGFATPGAIIVRW